MFQDLPKKENRCTLFVLLVMDQTVPETKHSMHQKFLGKKNGTLRANYQISNQESGDLMKVMYMVNKCAQCP